MAHAIRIAEPADAEAVTALLEKSYPALLAGAYDAALLQQVLPLMTRANPELLSSGSYYVAVGDDGMIVGAGGWTRHSPTGQGENGTNGNIRHFGTDPDHARKGIGRALIARCVEDARDAGLTELNCYSTLNGKVFYASCGFHTVEPFEIAFPGGLVFPSVRMVKPL